MSQTTDRPSVEVVTVTLNPAIDRTVTISNFAAGQVNRVEQMTQNPGGKGVNVAATLADYGHKVAVTGLLGRDNSASFEALFARKGIVDQFVRIAGQTRVGIKIVDPVRQQTTDINFPGEVSEPADREALFDRLAAIDARWVVLAGSLPPAIDATIYHDLVVALRAQGRKVVLDTSGAALQEALRAGPQVIKPNIHELAELLDRPLATPDEAVEAVRTLLGRGVELAVVSMGQAGAYFITADEVVSARPPRVEVKSTVGAGDAMVAGIVAAQLRGLPLAACARLATAFAVDAISRIGAGLSDAATIEALMDRVTVEEHASRVRSA